MNFTYRQLTPVDVDILKQLLKVFADAFCDVGAYQSVIPNDDYLVSLLSKPHFIALVAMNESEVVGGLVAYELEKFEQERKEIYIYDLAVSEQYRRKGIATGLINELRHGAQQRGAYVIYVQADVDDAPAVALYESLGEKEDVYHFNISVE